MADQLIQVERGFALLDGAAELNRTGLVIGRALSFDEWMELGAGLQAIESGIQWVLGDWVNYGEERYGEKYAQAVEQTGYTYQTLANMAYVAARVDFSRRRENLRFSHHAEIAAMPPEEQDALLDAAVDGHWSVQALREAVRTFKRELAPKPRELAPAVTITQAAPPKTEASPDILVELEHADKRIRQLESELESVTSDDSEKELRKLHARLAQTEARLQQVLAEKAEARKQAEYVEGVLKKIRKALGVERDKDILPAIQARAA